MSCRRTQFLFQSERVYYGFAFDSQCFWVKFRWFHSSVYVKIQVQFFVSVICSHKCKIICIRFHAFMWWRKTGMLTFFQIPVVRWIILRNIWLLLELIWLVLSAGVFFIHLHFKVKLTQSRSQLKNRIFLFNSRVYLKTQLEFFLLNSTFP